MVRGCLVALFVLSALPLRAQSQKTVLTSADRRHEVEIGLGAFHPTAKFGINGSTGDKGERFGGTGFLFTADYFHALTSYLSAGVEGMYINRGTYEVKNLAFAAFFSGTSTQVRGNTQAILATLRLRAPGDGVRPYVLCGFGGQKTTMDMVAVAPPGFIWGGGAGEEIQVVHGGASGVIGVLRGGVEKAFPDGGLLGLEVGWVGIPTATYLRTSFGRAVLPNDIVSRGDGITIAAKFAYRFAGGY